MRSHLPITQREHDFPVDAPLMSAPSMHGHFVYANAAFVDVGGFDQHAILGQLREGRSWMLLFCTFALSAGAAWACGLIGPSLPMWVGWAFIADLAVTLWLDGQITRPLDIVLKQALSVAARQPGANLALNRVDEIGMILKAANQSGLYLCSLAGDVGSPAQRSSTAAAQTAQTGRAISDIVSPVPSVIALINELGSSSVEQSAASAHSKQARTDRLLEAVAVVRLNSDTGGL